MAEVTAFGKLLRKLRIDYSEVLGTMAKKLGISPAYLSAIENNRRDIPDDFNAKIATKYNLEETQIKELEEAKAQTAGAVAVQFEGQKAERNYVETAVMFARDFSKLTSYQVEQLKNLLKSFENSGDVANGNGESV